MSWRQQSESDEEVNTPNGGDVLSGCPRSMYECPLCGANVCLRCRDILTSNLRPQPSPPLMQIADLQAQINDLRTTQVQQELNCCAPRAGSPWLYESCYCHSRGRLPSLESTPEDAGDMTAPARKMLKKKTVKRLASGTKSVKPRKHPETHEASAEKICELLCNEESSNDAQREAGDSLLDLRMEMWRVDPTATPSLDSAAPSEVDPLTEPCVEPPFSGLPLDNEDEEQKNCEEE